MAGPNGIRICSTPWSILPWRLGSLATTSTDNEQGDVRLQDRPALASQTIAEPFLTRCRRADMVRPTSGYQA
jgi:hypothetical protein